MQIRNLELLIYTLVLGEISTKSTTTTKSNKLAQQLTPSILKSMWKPPDALSTCFFKLRKINLKTIAKFQ